jgi:hypothetical protein|tara:strand:+ start:1120 stop:1398 length:279 start_codon:yes stop_codon:yes gene_type:complete
VDVDSIWIALIVGPIAAAIPAFLAYRQAKLSAKRVEPNGSGTVPTMLENLLQITKHISERVDGVTTQMRTHEQLNNERFRRIDERLENANHS